MGSPATLLRPKPGKPREIPSSEHRRESVAETIAELDDRGRTVEIHELESEYGIVGDEPSIDTLVVSPETAPELETINRLRREEGDEPLTGIVAPYVLAENGERISSTRVVEGEIDEHGRLLE